MAQLLSVWLGCPAHGQVRGLSGREGTCHIELPITNRVKLNIYCLYQSCQYYIEDHFGLVMGNKICQY